MVPRLKAMDFSLAPEQTAVRDLCRDFAREVVAPAAEELDREHRFGYDIVRQMGELGLFGLPFSEEYGGAGADFLSLCLAIEEISRADAGVGITLEAAVCLGAAPIHDFGSKEQKEKYLPDLLAGRKLWAFGLTEPEAGSDAGATLTALSGPDREISAFIVPAGTPGYHVQPSYRKLGWHSSDTHPLSFEDCRVPQENMLGERGGGYRQFLFTLMGGRVAIAALSVGVAQACLDASISYAKERRAFGVPLSKHQAIQFKIADMAMETELARTMVYRAAAAYQSAAGEASNEVRMLAGYAKLFASETSKRAADQAVQIHGGYGFMEDYPVARYWRDVKVN